MNHTPELIVIAVLLVVYLIPTAVAVAGRKRNAAAIATLNVLLGWTFLGWVAALVWSLMKDQPSAPHALAHSPSAQDPSA